MQSCSSRAPSVIRSSRRRLRDPSHHLVVVAAAARSFASKSVSDPPTSGQSGNVQAAPSSSGSSSSLGSSSTSSSSSSSSSSSPSSSSSQAAASPSSASSLSKKKNTDLALILSGALGVSALLFYNFRPSSIASQPPPPPSSLSSLSPSSRSFTLPIGSSGGATQFRTIDMLSSSSVNSVLSKNECSYSITRPGNPLYRYDTNSVASNETCEDAQAFTILEHEGNDWILASVFDGHSGYHTSRLMAQQLEKYIGRELMQVLTGGYRSLTVSKEGWWNWIWNGAKQGSPASGVQSNDSSGNPAGIEVDQRTTLIPEALRTAYRIADKDIIQSPINYLNSLNASSSSSPISDSQRSHGLSLLNPALSGSCSLSTLMDCSSSQLYVALAGDSRAVMGTYDPESKKWLAETLSDDQTGRNMKEVQRMRSEHPKNENETVIMRGRVLGGLEPTRSFGDGRYKFPLGIQEKLIQLFKPSSTRTNPPSLYKTPPYVTAEPEVTTFSLFPSSGSAHPGVPAQSDPLTNYTPLSTSTSGMAGNSTLSEQPIPTRDVGRRFIVLATDGLYDCLSSEEVVALVAGHLDGLKGDKSKKELFEKLGAPKAGKEGTVSPHKPRGDGGQGKRYCFEDTNIATHLTRNALGGAQREQVSALLSIPPPYSRRYRDDISITVLLLGNDPSNAPGQGGEKILQGVRRIWNGPEKAKL